MQAAVETRALTKRYGSHTAVAALDLTVQTGTVHGLIGPNGSGKTTTLRMLLDVVRPTSGTAWVLGLPPRSGGPALRRRIGFIPGDFRLGGRLRGRTVLQHFADISSPVPAGRIGQLAERLGLDLSRPAGTLSKGNRQKLALVQAFMHDPELLILDEPTSGLDPLVQREFLEMLREARDAGRTVLLSSHVLSEIQQAADRVTVLSFGRIVADGDVASLRLNGMRHVRASVSGADADRLRAELVPATGLQGSVVSRGPVVQIQGTLEGGVDPLVKLLAKYQVRDLTVEEPDLEESVLSLYGRKAEPGRSDVREGQ